jgi:hypothetical protein
MQGRQDLIKAWTYGQNRRAIQRLLEEGLHKIEISTVSFDGDKEEVDASLFELPLERNIGFSPPNEE